MHSGGTLGLRHDDVAAILQRGERVLSRREVREYEAPRRDFEPAPVVNVTIQTRDVERFRQSRTQGRGTEDVGVTIAQRCLWRIGLVISGAQLARRVFAAADAPREPPTACGHRRSHTGSRGPRYTGPFQRVPMTARTRLFCGRHCRGSRLAVPAAGSSLSSGRMGEFVDAKGRSAFQVMPIVKAKTGSNQSASTTRPVGRGCRSAHAAG